jgi:hypothetical protein
LLRIVVIATLSQSQAALEKNAEVQSTEVEKRTIAAPKKLQSGSLVLEIKRVWTYYRVSTTGQEKNSSLELQVWLCI